MEKEQTAVRRVMIATPCYDGKINAYHANSLAESCKIGLANGINIIPFYLCFDALIQRARNDIVKVAIESEVDDLIFIDADQDWNPLDLFKLLAHDVSVVAAPVVKKHDIEQYNVKLLGDFIVQDNGLVEVDGVGAGFMRIRKDALIKVYEASDQYYEIGNPNTGRMVFEVKTIDNQLYSEDIIFCNKLIELNENVYIDPTINIGHSGEKRWVGNFYNWIKLVKPQN